MTALHDSMVRTPIPYEAAGIGLLTTAFYAIPDFVKARPVRAALKTGALAVGGALLWHSTAPVSDDCDCCCNHDRETDGHCEDCVSADEAATLLDEPCACVDRPNPDSDCDCDATGECACGDNCWCIHATDEIQDWSEYESTGVPLIDNLRERPLTSMALIGGGLAAFTAAAVVGEKIVYKMAERQRAKGTRFPHTKQALVLGIAAAGVTALTGKLERYIY